MIALLINILFLLSALSSNYLIYLLDIFIKDPKYVLLLVKFVFYINQAYLYFTQIYAYYVNLGIVLL
jgi:hypothetical protein